MESRSIYRVRHGDTDTKRKELEDACELAKSLLGTKTALEESQTGHKNHFKYQDQIFIVYWYGDRAFFDIHHTIDILCLDKSQYNKAYAKYSNKIEHRRWFQNKHNGYVIQEMIPEFIEGSLR